MKKVLKVLLVIILTIPFIVKADSGLNASYDNNESVVGSLVSGGSSFSSGFGSLLSYQPGDEDYQGVRIFIAIVCLIILYIVTVVYLFKLVRPKVTKKKLLLFGIGLLPTILFSLFCFLIDLPVAVYLFLLIVYIILDILLTNLIIFIKYKIRINNAKKKDPSFDIEKFNEDAFNIYKDIQIAWMDFDLKTLKTLISKELYQDYETKLKELKNSKQKNIMENIEFKKNKIIDVYFDNNIEIIECELRVKCNDYIIDNDNNIVKGKKEKTNDYLYSLTYNKDLKKNKYILVEKKMKKQK